MGCDVEGCSWSDDPDGVCRFDELELDASEDEWVRVAQTCEALRLDEAETDEAEAAVSPMALLTEAIYESTRTEDAPDQEDCLGAARQCLEALSRAGWVLSR